MVSPSDSSPVLVAREPLIVLDAVLDNAAGMHVLNDLAYMHNYEELPPGQTVIGIHGSSSVAVVGRGTAYIETGKHLNGLCVQPGLTIKLEDVYYIPEASANLVSLARLTESGACFSQTPHSICIDKFERDPLSSSGGSWTTVLETSRCTSGFFSVPMRRKQESALITAPATDAEPGVLAHRKSGHAGYGGLQRLANTGMALGLGATSSELRAASQVPCLPCLKGKAQRKPAPPSSVRSTEPLGRVHADLQGPMPVKSLGGSQYVLEVYDEHTRLSAVTPLATKAEAPEALITILNRFATQANRRVKVLRTDHGSEFDNSNVQAYCNCLGIVREFSPPYDPRLNGRIERLGKTNGQRSLVVMIESKMPPELWAEAMVTVNHQRNMLPVTGLDITPHEAFYGTKPNISRWHPFGCLSLSLGSYKYA